LFPRHFASTFFSTSVLFPEAFFVSFQEECEDILEVEGEVQMNEELDLFFLIVSLIFVFDRAFSHPLKEIEKT